jgi:hypothetical protein
VLKNQRIYLKIEAADIPDLAEREMVVTRRGFFLAGCRRLLASTRLLACGISARRSASARALATVLSSTLASLAICA